MKHRRHHDPDQLTLSFESLTERLIAAGLVPNSFILDLNRGLTTPDRDWPYPWSLPSRAFRFPVEFMSAERSGEAQDKLLLRHLCLGAHPFMTEITAAIGVTPAFEPFDEFGRDITASACWWHAVDLMDETYWCDLLETSRFTNDDCMTRAVAFGLESQGANKKVGRVSTATAREIMAHLRAPEPKDRSYGQLVGKAVMGGELTETEGRRSTKRYPVNLMERGAAGAWVMIHGIEDGWFERDRGGFLQISATGRERRTVARHPEHQSIPLLEAAE